MRKLILHMQCSLDGYVSGPARELDWIFPDFDAEYPDWASSDELFSNRIPNPMNECYSVYKTGYSKSAKEVSRDAFH
jgi:hypothetical protein